MRESAHPPQPAQPQSDSLFAALGWFHWLVLAVSVSLTVFGFLFTQAQIEEKVHARFDRECEQVSALIVERMRKYEDALWAGVSAIEALGGEVSYAQWRHFAEAMRIEQKYPGINGIGVIHVVPENELAAYTAKQREARPDFQVHPPYNGAEHWVISFVEPAGINRKAIGLDVAHEENRRNAAKRARDTGRAEITAPIVLVQDAQRTPGFLFYAPIFHREDARSERATFKGHVYAPFVVRRLLEGILDRQHRHIGLAIRDGSEVLHDEHRADQPSFDPQPQYRMERKLELYGREWHLDMRSDRTFRNASVNTQPLIILCCGSAIDLLLLGLFVSLARSRQRAVAYADEVTVELRARNTALHQTGIELAQARDAAEQARDAAQAASSVKARFLATMSHELRTPLNGVIASAELLADASSPEQRYELTRTIVSSGRSLLHVINDILDFSKLEAKKVDLDPRPTSLRALLNDTADLLRPEAANKGLDLTVDVTPDVPSFVMADSLRLRQVLLNLTSNAVKFTERGAVSLRCAVTDPGTQRLRLEVRDTGIGIEDTSHLFDAFTQADASTTRRFGGTGLGLSICKLIVAVMGGEIGVQSEKAVGSSFWVELCLPATSARPSQLDKAAELEPHTAALPQPSSAQTRVALVADDNAVNRLVAARLLERLGWQVECVCDGRAAVEAARSKQFDVILMDCQMPELDGYDAARLILSEAKSAPPIIALSASILAEDHARCQAIGMADYLAKPVTLGALDAALARCVPAQNSEERATSRRAQRSG